MKSRVQRHIENTDIDIPRSTRVSKNNYLYDEVKVVSGELK